MDEAVRARVPAIETERLGAGVPAPGFAARSILRGELCRLPSPRGAHREESR